MLHPLLGVFMRIGTFDLPSNPTEAGRTGIVIYISHFTSTEVAEQRLAKKLMEIELWN